jgi:hypothetical protein
MPSEIIPLMVVLLIVFSALGYLRFLGRFPVLGKCDTIKRTYMLYVFAPLALLGADSSANSSDNAQFAPRNHALPDGHTPAREIDDGRETAMNRLAFAGAPMTSLLAASAFTPTRAADMSLEGALNVSKEPQNWLLHNFEGHRFSQLKDVNTDTVKNLKPVFSVALGGFESGGRYKFGHLEGTPIVENGMMYVTDGWDSVYAIDVSSGKKGAIKWKFDPGVDRPWGGDVACCERRRALEGQGDLDCARRAHVLAQQGNRPDGVGSQGRRLGHR